MLIISDLIDLVDKVFGGSYKKIRVSVTENEYTTCYNMNEMTLEQIKSINVKEELDYVDFKDGKILIFFSR